jgi:hypothetical protein
MAKHTPGPWTLRKPGDLADDRPHPFHFVEVAPHRYIRAEGTTEAEANANALLCFDAPAMLEALEQCAKALDAAFDSEGNPFGREHNNATDALLTARALIAKHMESNQ